MGKKVEYKITAVTVFPDRARVLCRGSLEVEPGHQTLVFDDLPLTLDIDSVRASGKGTGQVQIIGVDISRQHYEQSPSSRVLELEGQIESLRDDLRALEDQDASYEAQAEHLQGMRLETREYAKGLSRGSASVEDQTILIQFLVESDTEVRTAQREIGIERRQLERQLDKLHRELEELHNVRPRERYRAHLDIDAAAAIEFQPELAFVLRSAGWQPLYDIRLSQREGDRQLAISTIAQVTQSTGQDWTGVKLEVSTARPALNQRLPELKPWYLDEYQPPQPRHLRARSAMAEPTMAVMAAPPPEIEAAEMSDADFRDADMIRAQIKESGTVVTYVLSGHWDIPSDGSPHKMVLTSYEHEPKMDYITIPRHTDAVYRRAKVVNQGESPMLAGMATLFVDDDFIGKTRIVDTPLAGEMELLLGAEERISVERELIKREVDKRLLRENRIMRYAYEINLENLTEEPVVVEVRDQIPVARHEQIKVKLEQVRPEPKKVTDLNVLVWLIDLDPKQKKTVTYEFVVEHPRSLEIGGLIE